MLERIIGVFKLDRKVFAEVERDESATTQAAIVVAIVAALSVVGTILQVLINLVRGGKMELGATLFSIIVTFVVTFINWAIWAGVTYLIGTKLFKGTATMGEMLRVIGFAYAPRMLSIIPCIGGDRRDLVADRQLPCGQGRPRPGRHRDDRHDRGGVAGDHCHRRHPRDARSRWRDGTRGHQRPTWRLIADSDRLTQCPDRTGSAAGPVFCSPHLIY